MARIGELFPFGDVDDEVVARAAVRFEQIPAGDLVAFFTFGRAVVEMLERLPAPLEAAGLTPARWRLLIALLFQAGPEGSTIGDLAGHLGVKEPTVTATVDRAVADGLVERRRDPADGRVVRVVATSEGLATVARIVPDLARRISAFIESMGGRDRIADLGRELSTALAAAESTDHR